MKKYRIKEDRADLWLLAGYYSEDRTVDEATIERLSREWNDSKYSKTTGYVWNLWDDVEEVEGND